MKTDKQINNAEEEEKKTHKTKRLLMYLIRKTKQKKMVKIISQKMIRKVSKQKEYNK